MLKNANSAPYNLAQATINELSQAVANAKTRLAGTPATATAPAVTTQQITEEFDPVTLATIQLMMAATEATDAGKLAQAYAILAPAQQ